jgi:hypothetical protein
VTGKSIYPRGLAYFPDTTPWKGASIGRMRDRLMPMGSSVEAAAPIHQHLAESLLVDDRIDDEWVSARVWNVVQVVRAIEGDGGP